MAQIRSCGVGRCCLLSAFKQLNLSSQWNASRRNSSFDRSACFAWNRRFFKQPSSSWWLTCKNTNVLGSVEDGITGWTGHVEASQRRIDKVEEYLKTLSEEQIKAVYSRDQVIRVIAGPGSGKTRVIIARIAKLIADGCGPYSIMMLTFTNKAANEARNRLRSLLYESEMDLKGFTGGTFHSVCSRLLRKYIRVLRDGRTESFRIVDEDESEKIVLDILEKEYCVPIMSTDSKATVDAKKKQNKAIMQELRKKAKILAEHIAWIKEEMISVYGVKGDSISTEFGHYLDSPHKNDLGWTFDRYQAELKAKNLFDFEELIGCCVALLQRFPKVRQEMRMRYKHIFVDEMQDTNRSQYELLRLLTMNDSSCRTKTKTYLFVVGDPNQSIYEFRGAKVENLNSDMEKDFKDSMKTYFLLDNYRSSHSIIRYSENLLANFLPVSYYKKMKAVKSAEEQGIVSSSVDASGRNEATNIAYRVSQLVNNYGYAVNEIAVLYRTHSLSLALEEAFRANTVPYRIVRGTSFLKRSEIKDILAYLRFVADPNDRFAFDRIINKPKRGLGDKGLENLETWAIQNGLEFPTFLVSDLEDYWQEESKEIPRLDLPKEAKVTKAGKEGIQNLREAFVKMRKAAVDGYVVGAIDCLMYDLGFSQFLCEAHESDPKKKGSMLQCVTALKYSVPWTINQETDGLSQLKAFVQDSALSEEEGSDEPREGVQLMTMHAAKGLEFKVVFIIACEEGIIPHLSSTSFEEEARLMFVSITRAKEMLYISRAETRMQYGIWIRSLPSPFVRSLVS